MDERKKIRLVVADDHALFLSGLQSLLKDESVQVVGTAGNGKELLQLLRRHPADLVLLDINMPVCDGFDAAREIQRTFPFIKFVFLSSYSTQYLIDKARATGASAYLLKTCSKEKLLSVIDIVNRGETCFPPVQTAAISPITEQELFLKQFNITKREAEILHLIRNGLTSQQIAESLYLSVLTVDTHRKHIMQKLGAKNTAGLINFMNKHYL